MSRTHSHPLYLATSRLVSALDRLEAGLGRASADRDRQVRVQEQLMVFERENTELRQEREHLNQTLAQLQYQYNDLQKLASAAYGKLDDSVRRLTKIIDE